jgi:hypothetical protein
MLDRSTPNLFDTEPPSAGGEAEHPTVELPRPAETDRLTRAAPSSWPRRGPRPRRRPRSFSQASGGGLHRLPSRLRRPGRYLPLAIVLLLLVHSHLFAGHAKNAPALAAATPHTTIAAAAPPPASALSARPAPAQRAVRPARVPARRSPHVRVAGILGVHPVTRGRRAHRTRPTISAAPATGSSQRVSLPPAHQTPTAASPSAPAPASAPAPVPPAAAPVGHASGASTSEFGFEQ